MAEGASASPAAPADETSHGGASTRGMSFAQERLWVVDRLVDDKALYNTSMRFALDGDLDADAFHRAVQAVMQRHEVLRTGFDAEGACVVVHDARFDHVHEDFRTHPDPAAAALERQRLRAALPFDLQRPPLLRSSLYRVGEHRHEWLLTVHHIIFDGASIDVLLRELETIYPALAEGRPVASPPLALQAADVAAAERARLSGEYRQGLLDFWKKQLGGELPVLALPADRPRPAVQSFRGMTLHRPLDPGLYASLEATCRRERVTPFMLMLTACAIWLCRHASQDEVVIGSPFALRGDAASQGLIGFFVNTVALRLKVDGTTSFRQLLREARDLCLKSYPYGELPFADVAGALGTGRDLGHAPVFQAMLAVQNRHAPAQLSPDLLLRYLGELPIDKARFDVSMVLDFLGDGAELSLEVSLDLFDPPTAQRLFDRFLVLLASALADPEQAADRLALLPDAERAQLLDWATLPVASVPDTTVHALFERVAAAQPDAIALRHRDIALSFRTLDEQANALAGWLHAEGMRQGDLVGLCLPRTPDFVVAVLAVWKAGAAYVPLDPEQPAARHAYIANDAGLRAVLTQAAYGERFAAAGRDVWHLDDDALQRDVAACTARAPQAHDAAALAYVIYTSGSTGEPKGVLMEHRAVSRLLGSPEDLGYDRSTIMLQSINVAFDASVLETWAPLCCGGQLVLAPGQSLDLSTLPELIAHYGANTLTVPAPLLDLWVEQLDGPCGLARIVVGGEALSPVTMARLYALDANVAVFNHYGPTENGILSTCYPIPRDFTAPVPIGFAAPGTQLLVLNESQQLQPAGAIGELYLAGQGLARGYLGRAALTAEKFLPASHDAQSAHWYRTGDLVRWQASDTAGRATLQFIGRSDQQVKIRGFRIELGEIEAQLRACPGIQDARVVVRQPPGGERQIVAYVVAPEAAEVRHPWRAQLQDRLPAYMVPAAFVIVPSWPLTQNGKVDLKALPAPDRDAYSQQSFAEPETPTQHALLAAWRDLLKLDRISIDDNFFELGGQSLLATRLHNRLRAAFGTALPLRAMFEAQTIRRLAARLDDAARDASEHRPAWPPVTAMPPGEHAPLSYSQQRLWFIHRLDPDSAHYHIPWRLRLKGALDERALRRALRALVERHAVLRTTFREIGGEPRQVVQAAIDFALPLHDVGMLAEPQRTEAAERHLRDETLQPFDLGRDIPLRGRLIRLAADEHWLAMTAHHIAADGWTMGLVERELAALYAAQALPALDIQYADYAHWQRRWMDEASLAPQLDYWQQRLQGIPLLHGLPLDRPRPAAQTSRGDVLRQALPRELVAALRTLVQRHDATLFMGLHAAFALLLSRYGGETDIVVGTPIANRRDEALAPLAGLFINTLVLRSDLSADPAFVELLAQSREAALGAYEHQDLPFELLVERLNPPRHAAYSPVFQILFALQDDTAGAPRLPGLDVAAIPFAERYAKFDLALNLQPDGDALLAEWEYNADLFDAATVEQMAASYAVLLNAVVATPRARATRLPLLDAAARERVLALGNDTARDYAERDCLHTLIERQAVQAPDATAVIHGNARLSYAQLDRAANRLARHLRSLGVGPDVPVAVAMERGLPLVVGLLAILKAGGAYVPLDLGYPEARLAAMLADCEPAAVLASGDAVPHLRAALATAAMQAPVLDLQADADAWREHDDTGPVADVPSSAVAYIIYTSGSTGRPKGVMNEHRAIVNRLRWMQEAYPLDAHDRFLQTAAIGFGASVVEIFWPLVAGAQLVLTEGEGHKDPGYLTSVIRREQVTLLHFVPSMLQAFLDHPQAGDCASLARIFCGGEPMPGHFARRCRERLPHTRLYHLYGSSETAVLSTGWDCSRGAIPDNVPIGTPGANTRLYLLDLHGEPVPRGVRGEIHIAGRQVARGYLRHDALNAERFLADPFRDEPGARMYRSGDLGRQLPDGSIEHLGRNDFQMKIRGQRVEPGDIEAQLLAHPDVHQAVVIARDDGGGALTLAAYLVPSPGAPAGHALVAGLRTHLQSLLPAHMVPAAFVALPQFPLNANGKLDRQALPSPDAQASTVDAAPPEDDLQRDLLALWQELLKQPHLGVTTDFFAVGGHSLLALRLANRLRESFDHELDLKTFFAAPSIRALAEDIHRRRQVRLAAQRFNDADASEIVEF